MHQPERCGSAEMLLVSPFVLPFGAQAFSHITIVATVLVRLINTSVRAITKVWHTVLCTYIVQVCVGESERLRQQAAWVAQLYRVSPGQFSHGESK